MSLVRRFGKEKEKREKREREKREEKERRKRGENKRFAKKKMKKVFVVQFFVFFLFWSAQGSLVSEQSTGFSFFLSLFSLLHFLLIQFFF